jgi:hypothetical protein
MNVHDVQIHIFLTSAPAGGEWSAPRSHRLGKETLVPHCIKCCVGPRSSLDEVEKILDPTGNSDPSVVLPVSSSYTSTFSLSLNIISTHRIYMKVIGIFCSIRVVMSPTLCQPHLHKSRPRVEEG